MSKEKLRKPLPGRCQSRLRAGSYCKNHPLDNSDFCLLHFYKKKEWEKAKRDHSLRKHYDLIGKFWFEATTEVIVNEDPKLTLTDIFDFIQFSLEVEGIFTDRRSISNWFIETQKEYNHTVELLELKNRFHFGNTPYKKIIENGIPKTINEILSDFISANPHANLDLIIEGTGLTKDTIYSSARELGLKLEGQRDRGRGLLEIENLLRKIAQEIKIPQSEIIKIKSAQRANLFKIGDNKLYIKFTKVDTSWSLNRRLLESLVSQYKDFFVGLMHDDFNRIFIIPFHEIRDYIDPKFEEIHVGLKENNFLSFSGIPVYFEGDFWINNYKLRREPEWNM